MSDVEDVEAYVMGSAYECAACWQVRAGWAGASTGVCGAALAGRGRPKRPSPPPPAALSHPTILLP